MNDHHTIPPVSSNPCPKIHAPNTNKNVENAVLMAHTTGFLLKREREKEGGKKANKRFHIFLSSNIFSMILTFFQSNKANMYK